MSTTGRLPIVDGGDKSEIFEQLTNLGAGTDPEGFALTIKYRQRRYNIDVHVTGINAYDETGQIWILTGSIDEMHMVLSSYSWLWDDLLHGDRFEAYYDCKTRTGFISAIE